MSTLDPQQKALIDIEAAIGVAIAHARNAGIDGETAYTYAQEVAMRANRLYDKINGEDD